MVDIQSSLIIGLLALTIYIIWHKKSPFIASLLYIVLGFVVILSSFNTFSIAIGTIIILSSTIYMLTNLTQPLRVKT